MIAIRALQCVMVLALIAGIIGVRATVAEMPAAGVIGFGLGLAFMWFLLWLGTTAERHH